MQSLASPSVCTSPRRSARLRSAAHPNHGDAPGIPACDLLQGAAQRQCYDGVLQLTAKRSPLHRRCVHCVHSSASLCSHAPQR